MRYTLPMRLGGRPLRGGRLFFFGPVTAATAAERGDWSLPLVPGRGTTGPRTPTNRSPSPCTPGCGRRRAWSLSRTPVASLPGRLCGGSGMEERAWASITGGARCRAGQEFRLDFQRLGNQCRVQYSTECTRTTVHAVARLRLQCPHAPGPRGRSTPSRASRVSRRAVARN